MGRYTKEDIFRIIEEKDVKFIRLQFTDIFGTLKNVAITTSQVKKALDNECMFDGSSIEGFVRIEESDMYLRPDLDTFTLYPWHSKHGRIARLICDVYKPDGTPFEGDPRYILKKTIREAEEMGFSFNVGPECEFFLFNTERSLPYEVQYLKTADSLAFISNGNNQQKSIDLGTEITNLENLRSLSLIAYGIASLPEEMVNMKGLEYLDISVNNLSAVPEFLRQENFPNMKYLMIKSNRRVDLRDLSNTTEDLNTIGLYTEFPEWLLEWSNLRSLVLSNNYFYGSIPDMEDYGERYSAEEASALGKPELEGTPKVLPNTTTFSINLNRLTGELPQWLLLHPNLARWDPYVAVFNQEGKDADGKLAGFDNVPNDIF